jgi:hypothetical protein
MITFMVCLKIAVVQEIFQPDKFIKIHLHRECDNLYAFAAGALRLRTKKITSFMLLLRKKFIS